MRRQPFGLMKPSKSCPPKQQRKSWILNQKSKTESINWRNGSTQLMRLNLTDATTPGVGINQVQGAIGSSRHHDVSVRTAKEWRKKRPFLGWKMEGSSDHAATHTAGALNSSTSCGACEAWDVLTAHRHRALEDRVK